MHHKFQKNKKRSPVGCSQLGRIRCERRSSKSAGFTLVEVLVALTLFTIVASIATTGFVTILRSDREIGAFISVQTNTDLVIEQMAREIRTGRNFGFLSGDSTALLFTNYHNQLVLYCRQVFTVGGNNVGAILRIPNAVGLSSCPANAAYKVTSDDVNVSALQFALRLSPPSSPPLPPRITVSLTVAPATGSPTFLAPVNLETTVSGRNF